MDKTIKTKWLAALRGKKYRQALHQLRRGDKESGFSHCCLGVLLDVIAPERWDEQNHHGMCFGELSPYYRRRCGISKDQMEHLITLNDYEYAGYRKIANYIEKEM